MFRLISILSCLFVLITASPAYASGDSEPPPEQDWSFSGLLGTYDKAALQRGYKVYTNVCASCHSMKLHSFRNLSAFGYTPEEIKAIAANYTVMDGPNDEGEMFERPALGSDRFVSPFANKSAAMYANNGAFPPDMSLLSKARPHGADYIYSLLTGYHDAPHGEELMDGQYWNKYMPGHVLAMAPPLSDGLVAYEDGTPETASQYAMDISHFLAWAAEPHMEARKRIGLKAFIFLLVFTIVMYRVKKKIWSKAKVR